MTRAMLSSSNIITLVLSSSEMITLDHLVVPVLSIGTVTNSDPVMIISFS
jgi:hypothetical protein